MTTYFSPINRMTGLASGLDINKMVEDLMRAERAPLNRLLQQKQILEWQQADYRSINRALYDFRTNYAFNLSLTKTFQAYKATSGNEAVVTATPDSSAQTGTYSVTVHRLAEVASDISGDTLSADPVNNKIDPTQTLDSQAAKFRVAMSGTSHQFSITTYKADGTPITETFTVDTTTDSLNDVIARINAKSSTLGVTAFYESSTDKVVISTTRTGDYATNEIEISDVTGNFALGTLQLAATAQGTDAVVDINGLTGIKQHENTFTLNGVTFNLKSASASPVLVTVARDTDALFNTIKTFVEQYNATLDKLYAKLKEERYPDYLPLTDDQKKEMSDREIEQWEEKAKSGLLRNDALLNDITYKLRNALSTPVTGADPALDSLFDLGITTGAYWEGGKLYIDETKLREKIAADPDAVANLFTKSSKVYEEQGLGVRLAGELQNAIDRLSDKAGSVYTSTLYDQSYLSRSIRDLSDRISATEDRLAQIEERYWRQFTAMEQYIAQMNAQASWLAQQFSNYGG